ncbi:hypothetical protein Tco_1164441 [Tanacetum coccineum]
MQEVILFYNGLEVSTRKILDSNGAIPTKTAIDAKITIQEMAEYSQKWHNGTSKTRSIETFNGLAAIQAQLNNLGRKIKKVNEKVYAAQVGCELCKDCPLKEEGKCLEKVYYTQFDRRQSMEESLSKFITKSAKRHEENSNLIKEIRASTDAAIRNQGASIKALEIQIGQMSKVLQERGSRNRTVKHPKGIVENVLVGIGLRERMKLDLEARLMGETLILNRSLNALYRDYIKLNNLNEPLELKRNQVVDLEPTIKEGEVVYEPMMDLVRRIHINCAYNLTFLCTMGFEYVHANFLLIFPINVMSKKFYNSIMKDKIEFKRRNELGNFVNAPVFIGNFYVITNFTVVEDMDPYLDEGMGDVIVGEPFCKASCLEAKRFDGIITICNGDDSVTYQIVQSNPRFKHLTNEKCNKIPPLLKVSEQEKMNGISHSYQKLKGFYKGVLNRGPEFIRNVKVEEWLIRGHISMHEME